MPFFQKKPIVESSAPYYQLGLESTVLIVGLGNMGDEYKNTRHNIGFEILDHFAKKNDFEPWIKKKDLKSMISTKTIGNTRTILLKPTTMMNGSGEAVQATLHYFKLQADKTLIIHDEIDIQFGQIKLQNGGGPAGHNGIKSVIAHVGDETKRMRVGIGPKKPTQIDSSDFVLAIFSKTEVRKFPLLLQESNSILSEFTYGEGELLNETRKFIL